MITDGRGRIPHRFDGLKAREGSALQVGADDSNRVSSSRSRRQRPPGVKSGSVVHAAFTGEFVETPHHQLSFHYGWRRQERTLITERAGWVSAFSVLAFGN